MNIAFVVGSLAGGGAERVVAELCSELAKEQHKVSVILIASNRCSYEIDERVRIIDCTQTGSVRGLSFLNRVQNIRNAVIELGAEICVSFTVAVNLYSVLACAFTRCKLILAERNDPRFDPTSKLSRAMRRILYSFADAYVFQTEGEKTFFSRRIQKRSVVIPNPVNPLLPEPFDGERSKRVVTAVRLEPQKNLKMAIDAFIMVHKKYPEFRFEIYGEGSLRDSLEQYIKDFEMEGSIFLMGNSKNIYEDIRDAYAFILSSDYEGISNSMLEAMAMGIPTISTDYPSGGAREVINDCENGILVPVGNTDRLYEAMIRLIENPDYAAYLGNNAINIRSVLSIRTITAAWIMSIESLLEKMN